MQREYGGCWILMSVLVADSSPWQPCRWKWHYWDEVDKILVKFRDELRQKDEIQDILDEDR